MNEEVALNSLDKNFDFHCRLKIFERLKIYYIFITTIFSDK